MAEPEYLETISLGEWYLKVLMSDESQRMIDDIILDAFGV